MSSFNPSTKLVERRLAELETVQAFTIQRLFDGPLTRERLDRFEPSLRALNYKIKGAHSECVLIQLEDAGDDEG